MKKSARYDCLQKYINGYSYSIDNGNLAPLSCYKNNTNLKVNIGSCNENCKTALYGFNHGQLVEPGHMQLATNYSAELLQKIKKFAEQLVDLVLTEAVSQSSSIGWKIECSSHCDLELCRNDYRKRWLSKAFKNKYKMEDGFTFKNCKSNLSWIPDIPVHNSNTKSLKASPLSFSHESLASSVPFDDSHFITGAVSHDALLFPSTWKPKPLNEKVCSDIYSLPIDTLKPYKGPILQPKVISQHSKKSKVSKKVQENSRSSNSSHIKMKIKYKLESQRMKNASIQTEFSSQKSIAVRVKNSYSEPYSVATENISNGTLYHDSGRCKSNTKVIKNSNHNFKLCKIIPFLSCKRKQGSSLIEQRKCHSLSSSIRNSLVAFFTFKRTDIGGGISVNAKNEFINPCAFDSSNSSEVKWGKICPLPSAPPLCTSIENSAFKENVAVDPLLRRGSSGNSSTNFYPHMLDSTSNESLLSCHGLACGLKDQKCGISRENSPPEEAPAISQALKDVTSRELSISSLKPLSEVAARALPPVPLTEIGSVSAFDSENWNSFPSGRPDEGFDFASIIDKVKNYGWYWGPISGEAAEKVLSDEPDGSFIVRDSSDHHYIFSLTFRLNGVTRHVRIEHDQGNFSFGGFTLFKSQTIVEFIEKAIEHSRSGRYLFFLHRKPVLGPMRVQLLHPVSRFKRVQSLQHLCRFVIVKQVRKDLIHSLPLPQRLKDYLNSPHYYSEQVEHCMSASSSFLSEETTSITQSKQIETTASLDVTTTITDLPEAGHLHESTDGASTSRELLGSSDHCGLLGFFDKPTTIHNGPDVSEGSSNLNHNTLNTKLKSKDNSWSSHSSIGGFKPQTDHSHSSTKFRWFSSL